MRREGEPEAGYAADAEIWGGYHQWFNSLRPRQRQLGRLTGQWPEGTPEIYAQLYPKTADEEIKEVLSSLYEEQNQSHDPTENAEPYNWFPGLSKETMKMLHEQFSEPDDEIDPKESSGSQ